MAAKQKSADTAAKKDAPKAKPAAKPQPDASPAKPAPLEAMPMFVGPDGKTLSGVMAVLQVVDRYDEAMAEEVAATGHGWSLEGLPPRLQLSACSRRARTRRPSRRRARPGCSASTRTR
jgi:hypothetical protein